MVRGCLGGARRRQRLHRRDPRHRRPPRRPRRSVPDGAGPRPRRPELRAQRRGAAGARAGRRILRRRRHRRRGLGRGDGHRAPRPPGRGVEDGLRDVERSRGTRRPCAVPERPHRAPLRTADRQRRVRLAALAVARARRQRRAFAGDGRGLRHGAARAPRLRGRSLPRIGCGVPLPPTGGLPRHLPSGTPVRARHVELYRRYGRGRVDQRRELRRALASWWWLVRALPSLRRPEARTVYAWRAGQRIGRAEASVATRTLWL
jgi:hypothetical protein